MSKISRTTLINRKKEKKKRENMLYEKDEGLTHVVYYSHVSFDSFNTVAIIRRRECECRAYWVRYFWTQIRLLKTFLPGPGPNGSKIIPRNEK